VNNFLSQLNLTTQERRIVVIIILVVFVVVNVLLVWPHFEDWGRITKQLEDMRRTEENYNRAIQMDLNTNNGWRKEVDRLARQEGGSKIDTQVDPQNQLQQTILAEERKTHVTVGNFTPGPVKTNAFFEEHSTAITFESQEPQLVSFLYEMGNDPAMIRVAKLNLAPTDANRYSLKGAITLTANYAKKPAAAVSAPATVKPNFGAKPAAAPATKPAASTAAAQLAKHPPGGPPGPGAGKQPPGGPKTNPLSKLVPAPKAGSAQKPPGKNNEP
jgi:low affinity Fe/Cu permease